ncbi:TRAP transporter substrate-binding protein [Castellaniella sp.]|uniref:TRAP transporter substrate-binding protein n=1 Tax=Castellaniella sp. TaxID=1955812 RepID=UPI003C76EAB0
MTITRRDVLKGGAGLGLLGAGLGSISLPMIANAATLDVRFSWYLPNSSSTGKEGFDVAKRIKDLSGGSINVKTYPAGSLLQEYQSAEGVQNNTANMVILGMHWWGGKVPAMEWDTVPFLVKDVDVLLKAFHGPLGEYINELMKPHGVKFIGWSFYGYAFDYINARHPIKLPKDFNGLRMRSQGTLSAMFLKQQGATTVGMDSGEVYTSLQRGAVDGASSGLSDFLSRKWYEVAKYITAIKYVPIVYPIMTNLKWWEGLSPEQRQIISTAMKDAEADNLKNINDEYTNVIKVTRKNGNEVYEPNAEELSVWKKAYRPLLDEYLRLSGKEGRHVIELLQQAGATDVALS